MTHVHYLKEQGECGCGCGAYGTLKKPNRAGVRCVNRVCKCRSCLGREIAAFPSLLDAERWVCEEADRRAAQT